MRSPMRQRRKTTFLKELGKALSTSTSRNFVPLYVTFNGGSKVKRREGEGADGWLYRTIAHALLPEDNPLKDGLAEELGGLTCEKGVLEEYLKDKEDMVLLVDELNQLIGKSKNEAESEAEKRCAVFLKENFLQRAGAYLVFTSHIQSIRYDLINYMEGFRASDRQVKLASLPVVDKLEDLKKMDQTKFAGLTYMEATYFSRVPALLWTSRCGDHSLRNTFQRVSYGCEVIHKNLQRNCEQAGSNALLSSPAEMLPRLA